MSMPSLASETPSRATSKAPYRTRRTFAIISHPDAGKTTLTERLLAAAGAIQQAGAVRGQAGSALDPLGLDGDRAAARHFDHLLGDDLRV